MRTLFSAPINPFRNRVLRDSYGQACAHYANRTAVLFHAGVRPVTPGNSFASFFWRGYDGTKVGAGFTDRASRSTLGYAWYCAGRDIRRLEDSNK